MISSRLTFPLLVATLALSLCAVALIVRGTLNQPNVKVLAQACAEALESPKTTPASCPTPKAQPPESPTITIPPTTTHPGFSYPLGINAIAEETVSSTTITLAKSGLFFSTCIDCANDVIAVLSTAPFVLNANETLDHFVQAQYTGYPSAVIQKEVHANGTKYIITGHALEAPFGPFTHVRFFGATTEALVILPESDFLRANTAEHAAFLSSLDFSLIP